MHLLLVEDNPADALLVRTGMELIHSVHELHTVGDGAEALRFLHREEPFQKAPLPRLVILDLNMPRMDGRELLEVIRHDPRLSSLPILILTTTASAADIELCYRLGANSFVTKPTDIHDFFELIRSIESFWLRFSTPPALDETF